MSTGADSKTMPVTAEYEQGFERIFGKKEPTRGSWVQHPETGEMIPASEYLAPVGEEARFAPVMVDRFYENTAATDGTDIGSRKRHREYMRRHGLTTADDYKKTWEAQAARREAIKGLAQGKDGELPSKTRREAIERRWHELHKP